MILHYQQWCYVAHSFDLQGEAQQLLNADNGLLVGLLSSGKCSVPLLDETLLATPGSLLISKTDLALLPMGPMHIAAVQLKGEIAAAFAENIQQPLLLNGAACPGAAETICQLVQGTPPQSEQSAMCYMLLCQLATANTNVQPLPQLVAAAVEHILDHFAEVYGIEELASSLGVSKSHLIRSFTAATGVSPGKYLTTVRVEAAKRTLVNNPDYPLEVVAPLCGFAGSNYFCKVFKKATGLTPAEWRKRSAPAPSTVQAHELEEMLYL